MSATDLLARASALLLDFDGPVCSVFAGIPARTVADQLRITLTDYGCIDLPQAVAISNDPFDVLKYAVALGADEGRYVEAAFAAHEAEAISSATPTPGAHELITAWHRSGRPLAIVSNNGLSAISAYLDLYNLQPFVDSISARTATNVGRLKPDSHLLETALAALGISPARAVFIGDSVTDILAGNAIDVPVVAYANKSGKDEEFAAVNPAEITGSLVSLIA